MPFIPDKIEDFTFDQWLDDDRRIRKHGDHTAADFRRWFENGASNKFIMEQTGIRTNNTVQKLRLKWQAGKS